MKELSFKTRSRIVRTLGDRLISGENAAVIELVKNSYDADASFCRVSIDPQSDLIRVEDDGHGMTLDDVVNKWAELGTENKSNNKFSPNKRRVLGDKGIGRLATAKLGNKLEIISTSKKGKKLSSVKVWGLDWSLFLENEETYLEDVKFYTEELSPKDSIGTLLNISEISDTWTEETLKSLIEELRKLLSPLEENGEGFKIYLDIDAFTKTDHEFNGSELINGAKKASEIFDRSGAAYNEITPFPLLDACDYKFTGEFEGNAIRGVFHISEEARDYPIDVVVKDASTGCGFGIVHLNIFDKDADSVRNTFVKAGLFPASKKSSIPLRDARKALEELSGIAVYRDNFRIRPYGDADADWLKLDKRRVQNPSLRIEQAQVSGIVLVDEVEKSGLVERSSREGFEMNANYEQFKAIMLAIFREIEPIRFAYKEKTGKNRVSEKDKSKHLFKRLQEEATLKGLERISSKLPEKDAAKMSLAIDQHRTKVEHLVDSLEQRQALLEARSTLGFIIAEVIHEARHPTSAIGGDLNSLKKRVLKKWNTGINSEIQTELLAQFEEDLEHVARLEDLHSRMDPFLRMRPKKPQEYELREALNKSLLLFRGRIKGGKVKVDHPKEEIIRINGVEEDVITGVTNILDNALYWLIEREIKNPFIRINCEEKKESIAIYISDNAGGVPDTYAESIFNVGFSGKENGYGLGLSIARESLGRANAQISHRNIEDGSVFTIEIIKEL